MRYLPVTIRDKIAEYMSSEKMICYNSDYILQFTFDAEWDSYKQKTAQIRYFSTKKGWVKHDIIFTGLECNVPVIPNASVVYVGVYAGDIRTTTEAEISCRPSVLSYDGAPVNPPDDVYNQIMQKLNELEQAGVSPEQIAAAVEQYLTENPITAADVNAVPQNQGAENAGKFLGINESGDVVPVESGADGKSAYEYAQDGGYTGTEEEFSSKLAADIPIVDNTLTMSGDAADAKVVGEKFAEQEKVIADLETDVGKSVKTVNGIAPDDNGNVDVIANIEPPKIVSSVDEMTDTEKHYVLQSTGTIWANKTGTTTETVENNEYNPSYTTGLNLRLSTNDGTHRTGATGRYTTDFIEITPTVPYTVTLKGLSKDLIIVDDSYFYVYYYDAGKNYLGYASKVGLDNSITSGALPMSFDISKYANFSSAKFVRITVHISTSSLTTEDCAGLVINFAPKNTVETTTGMAWMDTGIPYAPTFKTDLIGVLGEDNVIYLSDNLPSGTYTLKYGDDNYATVGTISK